MKNTLRVSSAVLVGVVFIFSSAGAGFAENLQGTIPFPVLQTHCLANNSTASVVPCEVVTSLVSVNVIAPIIPVTNLRSVNDFVQSSVITSLRSINEIAPGALPVFRWNGFVSANFVNPIEIAPNDLPIFRWNGFVAPVLGR